MRATRVVQKILANYEGETPGVKANLCRMLMAGKLGGTGKMIILPVDQGFEHGPARSFAPNPAGYSLLKSRFEDDSISALGLFAAAFPPTIVAIVAFWGDRLAKSLF